MNPYRYATRDRTDQTTHPQTRHHRDEPTKNERSGRYGRTKKADDDVEIDEEAAAAAADDYCDENLGANEYGNDGYHDDGGEDHDDEDGNENGEHRVGERSTERRLT